jgi:hypothetical protein
MLSGLRLMLSTTKPLGSSQRLDMHATIDATLPYVQGEPPNVIESAPEPLLDAGRRPS